MKGLTDYMPTLFGSFYNSSIYIFFKNKLFKLLLSLECQYNKWQFGIRICSIEVKQTKAQHCYITLFLQQNIQLRKSILERLLFQELRDFEGFLVCIDDCVVFSKDWLLETAVKASKISLMTTVRLSAILFHLAHCLVKTEVKF